MYKLFHLKLYLQICHFTSTSMYSYSIPFWTTFPGSFFTTPSSVFVDTRNYWDSGQFVFLGIHRDPDTWRLPGVKSSRQQVTHTNSQNNIIWRIFNLFWPKTKTQFYQVICVLIPKKKTPYSYVLLWKIPDVLWFRFLDVYFTLSI